MQGPEAYPDFAQKWLPLASLQREGLLKSWLLMKFHCFTAHLIAEFPRGQLFTVQSSWTSLQR